MEKTFKTIGEQIEILKHKGLKFKNEDGYIYKRYDVKDIKIIKDAPPEEFDEEGYKNRKELEELENLEKMDIKGEMEENN